MNFKGHVNETKNLFESLQDVLQIRFSKRLDFDYKFLNYSFFHQKLSMPSFKVFHSETEWGYWKSRPIREIGINFKLIFEHPWENVISVLKHEMVHQYVDEIMGGSDTPHGEEFKKICIQINLPFHASCQFSFNENEVTEESAIFRKIKKMMALAESSNENEAKTAMTMANNLLLKHNISLSDVQNKNDYIHKYIGDVLGRIPMENSLIASILNDFFFVNILWSFSYNAMEDKKGHKLQICGLPENVEIAEYVYFYLIKQIEWLWQNYKKENNISQKLRKSYYLGLLTGLREKLELERSQCKERGLIWIGDIGLKNYFKKTNPKTKTVSAGGSLVDPNAVNDGIAEGKQMNIRMGLHKKDGFGGYLE